MIRVKITMTIMMMMMMIMMMIMIMLIMKMMMMIISLRWSEIKKCNDDGVDDEKYNCCFDFLSFYFGPAGVLRRRLLPGIGPFCCGQKGPKRPFGSNSHV